MYLLYGITTGWNYVGEREAVAKFSSKEAAQAYVDAVTLEKFPNGSRRFRGNSLLGAKSIYEIEKEEIVDLPINPKPPSSPPAIEYIAVLHEPRTNTKPFRFNHGRNKEEALKDIEYHKNLGWHVVLEERQI